MNVDLLERVVRMDDRNIDGHEKLWWVKGDHGSWDGPSKDWEGSHREQIAMRPAQKRVAVQAGGNMGMYPLLLSDLYGMVYTFEPDPLNFVCLSLNTARENIVRIQAAVADKNELVSINERATDNRGMNQISHEGTLFVPCFAIDQLNLPVCDLLWLDIEGSEHDAIIGSVETIARCHPLVVIETANQPTLDVLGALGYDHVGQSVADKIFEWKG